MKKFFIFNIIIIFFLTVLLELGARLFHLSDLMGTEDHLWIKKNKQIEYHALKPNSEGKIFTKKVYTDKFGYRVPNLNYKYSDEKKTIFFIGDSTTFGNGVIEKNTFVGKIRKLFVKKNIINSSVPGYNLPHYLNELNEIDKFKNISKVFYIYTLNDLSKISQDQEVNIEEEQINKLRSLKFFNQVNNFFRDKSYFYMWFKGTLTDPAARHFQYDFNAYKVKSNLIYLESSLNKINNYFIKKEIKLKIIILPYEYQTRKGNCTSKFLKPQDVLVKTLENMKINYSNYTDAFCDHPKSVTLFYKFDPMHLSIKGHDFVYNLLKNDI
jgi:lysophospholipase L1-like esterase